ncbi:MAG: hypothetical protein WAM83_19795, partial [Bradyrhizobium sp.]
RIPDPLPGTVPALIVVIQTSPAQQPIAGHVCCSATLISKFFGIVLSLLFVLCTIHRAPLSHGAPSGRIGAESRPRVDRQKVDMVALAGSQFRRQQDTITRLDRFAGRRVQMH